MSAHDSHPRIRPAPAGDPHGWFTVIGLSWLILGEPIRWYHFVGATVVIGGVALATAR